MNKQTLNYKKTVGVSVKGCVAREASCIAKKIGITRTKLLGISTDAGWPIIRKRWQNALKGIH